MLYSQNPIRPKSGVTSRVWDIADEITSAGGRQAGRQEVLERATGEGIHPGTVSKQYNDWRLSYENERQTRGVSEAPILPFSVMLQMGTDGRVLIPAEMRRLMKLDADGRLNAELVDGELRLFSPKIALEKLQTYVRANDQGRGSAVDELLAERREEARRE